MKSHHTGTRDTHAHTVLEDISADLDVEGVSVRIPPVTCESTLLLSYLHSFSRSESYCNRLGTSQSRLNFLSDQFNDLSLSCGHLLKNSKVNPIISFMFSSEVKDSIGNPRHTVL